MYSKGRRGQAGVFEGDSERKEKEASAKVKHAAEKFLAPIYAKCLAAARAYDELHSAAAAPAALAAPAFPAALSAATPAALTAAV